MHVAAVLSTGSARPASVLPIHVPRYVPIAEFAICLSRSRRFDDLAKAYIYCDIAQWCFHGVSINFHYATKACNQTHVQPGPRGHMFSLLYTPIVIKAQLFREEFFLIALSYQGEKMTIKNCIDRVVRKVGRQLIGETVRAMQQR